MKQSFTMKQKRTNVINISADFQFNKKVDLSKLKNFIRYDSANKHDYINIKIHGAFAIVFSSGRVMMRNVRNTSTVQNAVDTLCVIFDCKDRPIIHFSNFCAKTDTSSIIDIFALHDFLRNDSNTLIVRLKSDFSSLTWIGKATPARLYVDRTGNITTMRNLTKQDALISLRAMKVHIHQVS